MNETLPLAVARSFTIVNLPTGTATNNTFLWSGSAWTLGTLGSLSDSAFEVKDSTDPTKKFALECSNISTATTRTYTIADRLTMLTTLNYGTSTSTLLTGNLTYAITSGSYNTGYGVNALDSVSTGANNTALGYNALTAISTVSNNIAVGYQALLLSTLADNIAIGANALDANTVSTQMTAIGYNAATAITAATFGIAIGYNALQSFTNNNINVAIGSGTVGTATTSYQSTCVGYNSVTTAAWVNKPTSLGYQALRNAAAGGQAGFGYRALQAIGGSSEVAGIGAYALENSGFVNVGIGYRAGVNMATSGSNVTIGSSSGLTIGFGSGVNTIIGYNTSATHNLRTGCIMLGANGSATSDNQLVIKAQTAGAIRGTAVLVAGTVTVNVASVTADTIIILMCQTPGGTPGFLRISARVANTSFTITSSNAADTSTVGYFMFEP